MHQKDEQKCIWSGQRSPDVIPVTLTTVDRFAFTTEETFYVCPQHEEKLRAFNQRLVTHAQTFLYAILGLTLLLLVATFSSMALGFTEYYILLTVASIISVMGGLIIIFPFSTPETIQWLGIRKAIKLTRSIGVLTVILGLAICICPFM